jgi:hypothetical protein
MMGRNNTLKSVFNYGPWGIVLDVQQKLNFKLEILLGPNKPFKLAMVDTQSATERCGQTWARVPHTNTRKTVHINMCPETFQFELQLKEYVYNKCSKCSPGDSTNASTRLIMDRRIRSKTPG